MVEVETAIRAVPNADNVQVDCDPDFYDEPLGLWNELPNLTEGDGPYPYLDYGRIAFDLRIPLGLQEELGRSPLPLTFTERFHVNIHYMLGFPIATLQLVKPESKPDPSEAVIIVRRLLEREFERQENSFVNFQFMGPSPVHADFYLVPESESRRSAPWVFNLEVAYQRGYDQYNFSFNENHFPSAEEALDTLLRDVLHELDLYYLIVQYEREKIRAWAELQELSSLLVDLHQKNGFKAYFAKMFNTSTLVNQAFISLSEFEGSSILKDNNLRDSYRSTYASDTAPYLREIVDRAIEERAVYPSEQVNSLLQLFEARRLSAVELRVILISAISGGTFGALITALLGGN